MKKIIFTSFIACFGLLMVSAQTGTTSFTVAGIKVIYKPTQKQVVNVSVYFKGGVNNYPAGQAGIESLAINALSQCGTAKYTKDAFKDIEDNYGIDVFGETNRDCSNISLYGINQYFNDGWALLADAVTNPAFTESEFNKMKQKIIAGLRQSSADPDTRLSNMALENAFAGTVYAVSGRGTEETLNGITAAAAKDYYYKTLLNKNRMFIVVVGNISKADITAKITAAFASLPSAPYQQVAMQTPVFTGNTTNIEERKIATNYIQGMMNAPVFTSADDIPFRLAFASLQNKLFDEVRTKRNLSYAPDAFVGSNILPYSVIYVTTTNPKAAVEVMANLVDSLGKNGFSATDLRDSKALYITSNYMKDESTNAIAESLGSAEVLGNWKLDEEAPGIINSTTQAQMSGAFRKYITGIKWNYLGVKAQADEAAASFSLPVAK